MKFEWIDAGLVFNGQQEGIRFAGGELMQGHGVLFGVELWIEADYRYQGEMYRIATGGDPSYPNEVLTRDEAMTALWSIFGIPMTNVITLPHLHENLLRARVPDANNEISTRWGRGF